MNETATRPDMDFSDISLLYPDASDIKFERGISDYDSDRLELYELIDLRSASLGEYFTSSPEVIRYRQATFSDLTENPELCRVLSRMLPFLNDITELRTLSDDSVSVGDTYLYSITEAEIYNSLIALLRDELLPFREKVSSPAMTALCERIAVLAESDYYKTLSEKLDELSKRVRDIKSVTMGVNLDSRLQPVSAGVVSVNSESFKSGDFFDRVMSLDFKKEDMTCIADLIPYSKNQNENKKAALANAFNTAISEVFKGSLKDWKKACRYYVLENTDFLLRIAPEIEFLTKAAQLITKLKELGVTLTMPEIRPSAEKVFEAKALANPVIAVRTGASVVPNDFSFDDKGMIYIITGPNRGGKSVITCAVGHAFAMAQMGLPVCAEKAILSPCDKILTHFPGDSADTVDKGRLGEECARLGSIFDEITENSLVLLDESLSSTSAFEGSYIASEILCGFSIARCRVVFSTHLHDLAASIGEINRKCTEMGGVMLDSLVAEVKDGERSFKIVRKTPDGKSYASDIAAKYGLSFDKINEKIFKKRD